MSTGQYEGAFASAPIAGNLEPLAPFASALSCSGGFKAGPGGVLQGRFGFVDPSTGLALNSQTTAADTLGVVIPLRSYNAANGGVIGGPPAFGGPVASWSWQTYDAVFKAWRMREGIVITLMNAGNFYLKFAGGANYGDTVYASLTDGSAISGNPGAGAVVTPFLVCDDVGAGRLARVSSTARFNL